MQRQEEMTGKGAAQQQQLAKPVLKAFEWFAFMRANHPVVHDEQLDCWYAFRYDDVSRVVTDQQTFSSENVPNFSDAFLDETIVSQDPPNHRRLRNVIGQALSVPMMNNLKDSITQTTQELLDGLRPQGKVEIISEFARPLTEKMLARLLGLPDSDLPLLHEWTQVLGEGPKAQSQEEVEQIRNGAGDEVYAHLTQFLARYRQGNTTPDVQNGLIAVLSRTEVNGERLSDDELIKFCILLMAAGQTTVQRLLTNAMFCLMKTPGSRELLIQQPELMPSAIDETLRFLPPFWIAVRRTLVETELGGEHIPAGQIIQAWSTSANHDEAYFPDAERFDIQRKPNRHLSFGHGAHFCIGAPLARLEAQIALNMLLKQCKNLRHIPNTPGAITPGPIHTIVALPLMFDV